MGLIWWRGRTRNHYRRAPKHNDSLLNLVSKLVLNGNNKLKLRRLSEPVGKLLNMIHMVDKNVEF